MGQLKDSLNKENSLLILAKIKDTIIIYGQEEWHKYDGYCKKKQPRRINLRSIQSTYSWDIRWDPKLYNLIKCTKLNNTVHAVKFDRLQNNSTISTSLKMIYTGTSLWPVTGISHYKENILSKKALRFIVSPWSNWCFHRWRSIRYFMSELLSCWNWRNLSI